MRISDWSSDVCSSDLVTGAKNGPKGKGDGVALTLEPAAGGTAEELKTDVVLVAIGRRPFTEGLGLKELGVAMTNRGFIEVDENFQTSVPGIYAIGDCVPGPMLAHKPEAARSDERRVGKELDRTGKYRGWQD